MKIKATTLILAVCSATFFVSSNAQEWTQALQKVNEIKTIISGAITKIKALAEKDNPEVAKVLNPKIDLTISKATEVLEKTVSAIDGKTLTEEQGKKLFEELKDDILGVQAQAQDEMKKLSPEAAGEIRMTFITAYGQAALAASQGFALLKPKA